jgi:hypothetical protein
MASTFLKVVIAANVAGIADGGELYIRPPGTAAWLFDKVKY